MNILAMMMNCCISFIPDLHPNRCSDTGNRAYGQFVTVLLCCFFLLFSPVLLLVLPWAAVPVRKNLFLHRFLQEIANSCNMESFTGCSVDICSSVVFSTGCRDISASVPEAPLPSPSPTLGLTRLFLTLFFPHSPLSVQHFTLS